MKTKAILIIISFITINSYSQNQNTPFWPFFDLKKIYVVDKDEIKYELEYGNTNFIQYGFIEGHLRVYFGKKDYIYIPVRIEFIGDNFASIQLKIIEGNILAGCTKKLKRNKVFNLEYNWDKMSGELKSNSFNSPFYMPDVKSEVDCISHIAFQVFMQCKHGWF